MREHCSQATVQYSAAVNAVMINRGKVDQEEYTRIRGMVDEARKASRAARTALEKHKQEHGC